MIAACDLTDAELATARTRARQATTRLITGTGLTLQEHTYELTVDNPHALFTGTVHVDYATGLACWEHTVWDELGYLPGYLTRSHLGHLHPGIISTALDPPPQPVPG